MNDSKIAVRYAKALFLTAKEKNFLEQVRNDMTLISAVLKENGLFKSALFRPITKPSERERFINIAFGEKRIHEISFNFLKLLIANNRIQFVEDISRVFMDIYRKEKGILFANLTTTGNITEELHLKFKNVLKAIYHSEIELSATVNEEIIGGFVLTVEDKQYNASIANKLQKLKKSLHN
jgi:F-type H+-transporting ATPase subunit delta